MSAGLEKALLREARAVARGLRERRIRLVLAESCTGGLVAASLATVPGISEFLCGSAVVYRDETKRAWLGVATRGQAVSARVAREMALGALARTREAEVSAAITGHLGPGAPTRGDGRAFVAIARRGRRRICAVQEISLQKSARADAQLRRRRQILAAISVFLALRAALEDQ
jgi:PncC family amidohydrolase